MNEKRKSSVASNHKNPYNSLIENLHNFCSRFLSPDEIGDQLTLIPKRYCKYGDALIFNETIGNFLQHSFYSRLNDDDKREFWKIVSDTFKSAKIIAVYGIENGSMTRRPRAALLHGTDSLIDCVENGIHVQWDLREVMFSRGNVSEKLRLSRIDCRNEIVVDLFAGIGYFSLSYLIHSRARFVYACEINPDSVKWLRRNLLANKVSPDRYAIIEGDCETAAIDRVAQRINLGLIPDCRRYWSTACRMISLETGAVLHIHENVNSKPSPDDIDSIEPVDFSCNKPIKPKWLSFVSEAKAIICQCLKESTDLEWKIDCVHLEHVKSYAPHIDHLVLDLSCVPL